MAQSDTEKQAGFDKLIARGKPKPTRQLNIAIDVHGYLPDEGFVVGADIKTGEVLKAKLAPYTPPEPKEGERRKPSAKRPEIADFAAPKHKVHTPEGGVLLLEGAYTRDGITTAKWITSMVKDNGMLLSGSVQPMQPEEIKQGKEAFFVQRVRFLDDQQSSLVNSKSDLNQALVRALSSDLPGVPMAMIRAEGRDAKGELAVRSMTVYTKFDTVEVPDGNGTKKTSVAASPENSVAGFLNGEDGKLLQEIVGAVRMEVVPGTILTVGRDTLIGRMERNRTFDRAFTPKQAEGDTRRAYPKWAPGFIGIDFNGPKAIVTNVSREQPNGPLYDLKDLPTLHSSRPDTPDLPDPEYDGDFPMDGPEDAFERRPQSAAAPQKPAASDQGPAPSARKR